MKSTYPSSKHGKWTVIGTMSGTSLDGLDLCVVTFERHAKGWSFEIESAETLNYSDEWRSSLANAHQLRPTELHALDVRYSAYIKDSVKAHLQHMHTTQIDLMGSHGHTVFHEPEKGLTLQIGNQPEVKSGLPFPVVCDFRVADVQLGGQGAPLVPIGDTLLFDEYDVCLNLGGFANLSMGICTDRIAWDVAPVNIVLNGLTEKLGLPYDEYGRIARSHKANTEVIESLNRIPFYHQSPPKSLGREWVEAFFLPKIDHLSTKEAIATVTQHSAFQIGRALHDLNAKKILCTGGGTLNSYLIEHIEKAAGVSLYIPDEKLLHFKEALIFAFLGLLRHLGEVNVLSSVTGASHDHSSGVIYS